MTDFTRVRPQPDVMGCQLGDGLALLDTRSGIYFQLNDVGTYVWGILDGRPLAEVVASVVQAYAIPAAQVESVREDVCAVVRDMLENGLVMADDAAAA